LGWFRTGAEFAQMGFPANCTFPLTKTHTAEAMLVHDLTRHDCIEFLTRKRLGRLGCARDGQPYITPFFFAFEADALYSFSTHGQKIAWMRSNPLVCVETDDIETPQKWTSVVVFGRYEELPDTPEFEASRRSAYALLQQRPQWWEPGYVRTVLHGAERPLELVYFRIQIGAVSGHRAMP
jgi:nitroimidazol reductase NimA-like FMN-containing flavoprotein (pyridoxamine 5'-phosphate oxidase superfamily)